MHRVGFGRLLPFSPTGILSVWDHIVHQFTQRHLTYDSDRLPALSGIAKTIYYTGALGRYFAGLWEARLAEGLLWFVNPATVGFAPLPPSRSLTAPSWSWASVKGTWDYRRTSLDQGSLYSVGGSESLYVTNGLELDMVGFSCKDMTMEVNFATPDPFGGVKLGKVTLTAPVTSVMITYVPTDENNSYGNRFKDQRVKLTNGDLTSEPFMDFVVDYGENPIQSGSTVYCVGIQPDPQVTRANRGCHGLVLMLEDNTKQKLYKSVGKFLAPIGWFDGVELQVLSII